MEFDKKFKEQGVSPDVQKRLNLAREIEGAMFEGIPGKFFNPNKIDQSNLLYLKEIVDEVVDWRKRPNTDKSFC